VPTKKGQVLAVQSLTLAGQWRVVALGNTSVDSKQLPMFMTANGDRIFSNSQCVWWYWAHQIDGSRFSAKPTPRLTKTDNGEMVPPAMCARPFNLHEQRFAKAIESADTITAASPTEMILTGKEDTVKLERRPNIEGRWKMKSLSIRPLAPTDYPLLLDIGNHQITVRSQCVSLYWSYHLSGTAIRTLPKSLDEPMCERSRTATERAVEALMGDIDSWRTLADQSMELRAGNETITLEPHP
jgi:hypothetical protein